MTQITGGGIQGPSLKPAGAALGLWKQRREPCPPFISPTAVPLFEKSLAEPRKESTEASEVPESDLKDFEMEFGEYILEQDDEEPEAEPEPEPELDLDALEAELNQ